MFRIIDRFPILGVQTSAYKTFVRDIQCTDIFHIRMNKYDSTRYIETSGIKGYYYNKYFLVTWRRYDAVLLEIYGQHD